MTAGAYGFAPGIFGASPPPCKGMPKPKIPRPAEIAVAAPSLSKGHSPARCLLGTRSKIPLPVGCRLNWKRKGPQDHAFPVWVIFDMAMATAALRVSTPSFSKICSRCLFTVLGLLPRIRPMS